MSGTDGVLTILNVVVLLLGLILLGMSSANRTLNRDVMDGAAAHISSAS